MQNKSFLLLLALSVAVFGVITTEIAIIGLLPKLVSQLNVTPTITFQSMRELSEAGRLFTGTVIRSLELNQPQRAGEGKQDISQRLVFRRLLEEIDRCWQHMSTKLSPDRDA
ncbi:TPA: hypothetical protein ACH1LL_000289 [Salmonella enterica subsp. enterica serovar Typhimurium]|uniref:hypothetical protein n=1 Tax=Enterobacteriaceae TaxID=543 RepID=UPI002238F29A|nr:hypothetical protein [Enterobacter hormaechei]MCW4743891.1 hypothetical protein [Enterobacter hormaechei subsp. hoffmannii]MDK2356637.1 hypothetical protein [Enterobacter hormaechei]